MVGPSKILTVSYGTFSCTLEGFDEPFGTMQAIAEYFRDLAAQDRYFGAEPPTPDAEMLHRIAEREVQRRVESRVQENGIILRQQSEPASETALNAPAAPAASVAAMAIAQDDIPEVAAYEGTPDLPTDASDKLARIRAAVAKSERDTPAPMQAAAPESAQEDTVATDVAAMLAEVGDDIADETQDSLIAASADSKDEFDLFAPDSPDEDEPPATEAQDSMQDAETDDAFAVAEDIQSDDDTSMFADPRHPTQGRDELDDFGLFDEEDESPKPAARPVAQIATAATAAVASTLASRRGGDKAPDMPEEPSAQDIADATDSDDNDDTDAGYRNAPETLTAEETAAADTASAETFDDDEFEAELEREMQESARLEEERHSIETLRSEIREVLGKTGLSGQSESALVQELAEIEKEAVNAHPYFNRKAKKRIPGDTESTAERLLETAKSAMGERDSKRRRETFEHIKVAVAATRAEEDAEGPRRRDIELDREIDKYRAGMDTPAPMDPALARAESRARAAEEQTTSDMWDEDEGADDTAPVQAEESPAKRAPAMMRPAAAELAPKVPASADADEEIIDTPRPRRPALVGARRVERPAATRAPLVLVSEQRVDAAPATSGPIRPRRVRSGESAEPILAESAAPAIDDASLDMFKTFAQDVDAWLLDDQIEAAAAFSTHILGQEEFSRPELMAFVLAYNEGKEVSREDMLRGFGTLLREGRLERGDAGQFRLAPASEYDEPARKYAAR